MWSRQVLASCCVYFQIVTSRSKFQYGYDHQCQELEIIRFDRLVRNKCACRWLQFTIYGILSRIFQSTCIGLSAISLHTFQTDSLERFALHGKASNCRLAVEFWNLLVFVLRRWQIIREKIWWMRRDDSVSFLGCRSWADHKTGVLGYFTKPSLDACTASFLNRIKTYLAADAMKGFVQPHFAYPINGGRLSRSCMMQGNTKTRLMDGCATSRPELMTFFFQLFFWHK